jgi:hypothetical protein
MSTHTEPQQTPCTQCPLMQPASPLHPPPFGERLVQEPPWQVSPEMQSPSPPQVVRQALLDPHTYSPQSVGVCLHAPAPVQLPIGVKVIPTQAAVPQEVEVGAFRQAPAPSHVPVKPQGGLGGQRPCGSAAPAVTSAQAPSLPATLQARHEPQLAVEQQTPSTQKFPLRHSLSAAQSWPRRFLSPQVFTATSQMLGGAQSASPVQVALHAVPLQA